MAAADRLIDVFPAQLSPINGRLELVPALGDSGGVLMAPLGKTDGYYFWIPAWNTNGTPVFGATFVFPIVDDPRPGMRGAGLVARIGLAGKLITSGTDTLDFSSGAGTEVVTSVTLDATTGEATLASIALLTGTVDTPIAASWILCRIRRVDSSSDTHKGRVLLGPINVRESAAA